ncbi:MULTISPECIES: radical SAM protein [Bacillus]|uniref:radical SAM protein n=1 Tax=Bacillus TaxID=1386 RepID=UPI000A9ADF68|nr:radical SAM protein [Bacillus altitudinis]MCY7671339.1 radical SAM protein [Bacillus altitudinis]
MNYIVKISSRCNLNCTYCYMYNKGDTTYLSKPKVMNKQIAYNSLKRIFEHLVKHGAAEVNICLHGGEPLLCGKEWIVWFFNKVEEMKPKKIKVNYSLQTNGVLLDDEWLSLLASKKVQLGISLDGLPEAHNQNRVDHNGEGSYNRVIEGLNLVLRSEYKDFGVLVVANPDHSGEEIYNHLVGLGIKFMDFLWPFDNHDNIPNFKQSLASYYISIFDSWYEGNNPEIEIRWFDNIIRMIFSGHSKIDAIGPVSINETVIETDGSLEPLDSLRTSKEKMTRLGLNVLNNSIDDLIATELYQLCLHNQDFLPQSCKTCSVYQYCGGGYIAQRWKSDTGFKNSNVHCNDLFEVISYIYNRVVSDLTRYNIPFQYSEVET